MHHGSIGPDHHSVCELNCQIVNVVDAASAGGIPPLWIKRMSPRLAVKATAPTVIVDAPAHPGQGAPLQAQASRLGGIWVLAHVAASAVMGGVARAAALLAGEDPAVEASPSEENLPPMAWHPKLRRLAAADGAGRVLVFDLESPGAEPLVLVHELQRRVSGLAWRPNAGGTLAVACSTGVCLWKLGRGGVLGGGKAATGAGGESGAWMQFLAPPKGGLGAGGATTLAWSPDGLLLAEASCGAGPLSRARINVWDVALGVPVSVRGGLGATGLLLWSPCGSYLLAATTGAAFYIWETHTWSCRRWSSPAGRVTAAAWSPDGRVLVTASSRGRQLAAMHFAAPAPSLTAHVLPLDLPGVSGGSGGGDAAGGGCEEGGAVEALAWDPRGERLAVALPAGAGAGGGGVALFSVRHAPVISASPIGHLRAPPTAPGMEEGLAEEGGGGAAGGGGGRRRILAFHPDFPPGALLAERRAGGLVAFYPLYYSPQ